MRYSSFLLPMALVIIILLILFSVITGHALDQSLPPAPTPTAPPLLRPTQAPIVIPVLDGVVVAPVSAGEACATPLDAPHSPC